MTTQITSTGFERDRLDAIFAGYQAAMRAIFGADINVDPDSLDGQMLGIFAEGISNEDQLAEAVYNSFNPSLSFGHGLSRLVQINGIRRIAGAYSSVIVTFTGVANTVIPSGTLVSQETTQTKFSTAADATIGAGGTVSVACLATEIGAIVAPAGSITKVVTPMYGVNAVTNALAATQGRNEETDEELRIRRVHSVAIASQSLGDSLDASLLNVTNVTAAKVFENFTQSTDSNGMPPHSICCIVKGGADSEIAQAIWIAKSLGATQYGNSSGLATDSIGRTHTVIFSRPVVVPIFVHITISVRAGYPTTAVSDIKAAIVAWGLKNESIGDEVILSRIYEPINTVAGFAVNSLTIGTSDGSTSAANIAMAFDHIASFDAANITITVTG